MNYLLKLSIYNRIIHKLYYITNRYRLFFTILLFIGFIISAPFTYFVPSLRYIAAIIIFLYLIVTIFTNYWTDKQLFIFQIFLILYLFIQLFLNQIRDYNADFSILFSILFATLFLKNIEQIIRILKIIIIINFVIMIYEVITFEYIINIVEVNKYQFGRMQGLFSYSKEAGYFLLITFIFIRYFNVILFYQLIIFLSSFMSGSRTAMLFIGFILIIDNIYLIHKKITLYKFIKRYISLFFILYVGLVLFTYYFNEDNIYILNRILNSFNMESSSQSERIVFWKSYFFAFNDYNIIELLFGKGTYLNHQIDNGAESAYLMLFSQLGLIGL